MTSLPVPAQGLTAGLAYFALVFAAGFALGTIRVLALVPALGTRTAELVEMPVMLAVVWFSARFLVRRLAVPPDTTSRLAMGFVALALMLVFEFMVVLPLRGMTLRQYREDFDPVAGSAYYVAQLAMALLPWWLARHRGRS